MTAREFLIANEHAPTKPWFDTENEYFLLSAKVLDKYADQQTASLRKELEEVKNECINSELRFGAIYAKERAKSAKLLEALENISSIPYAGECGNIAHRAISEYEKGGSDATKD